MSHVWSQIVYVYFRRNIFLKEQDLRQPEILAVFTAHTLFFIPEGEMRYTNWHLYLLPLPLQCCNLVNEWMCWMLCDQHAVKKISPSYQTVWTAWTLDLLSTLRWSTRGPSVCLSVRPSSSLLAAILCLYLGMCWISTPTPLVRSIGHLW